jgi:hypothetical protein
MTPHEFHTAAGAPTTRTFRIAMSDRCFRFKPDALANHAPARPGVYEFVAFDAKGEGKILFVGIAETSIQAALDEHLTDQRAPTAKTLFAKYPNAVYFDYVAGSDGKEPADLKDIAGILMARAKPEFNDPTAIPSSGRFSHVDVQEVEIV